MISCDLTAKRGTAVRAFVDTRGSKEDALKLIDEWISLGGDYPSCGSYVVDAFLWKGECFYSSVDQVYGIPWTLYSVWLTFGGYGTGLAELIKATPEGADLTAVLDQFMVWILTDPEMIRQPASAKGRAAMDLAADTYRRRARQEEIAAKDWVKVAALARKAAAREPGTYHDPDLGTPAWAAAQTVEEITKCWIDPDNQDPEIAVHLAIGRVADGPGFKSGRELVNRKMMDKLIDLLRSAPVDLPAPSLPKP